MTHIVWDWNGTLFDDLEIIVEAVNVSLRGIGAGPIDVSVYRALYQRPMHHFYEAVLCRPVGAEEMEVIDDGFHDAYHKLMDRARLTEDAVAAVKLAADRGATQSVLSMWYEDRLVEILRRLGLGEYMVAVAGRRGRHGTTKAEPLARHVEQLGEFLGVGNVSIVAIGDVTDDAAAARACGIGCVLYDGGSLERSALEGEGVAVADTLVDAVEKALSLGAASLPP
jgi:phosphoglycolate phosphatase-like HAD superfamily hydrolase